MGSSPSHPGKPRLDPTFQKALSKNNLFFGRQRGPGKIAKIFLCRH